LTSQPFSLAMGTDVQSQYINTYQLKNINYHFDIFDFILCKSSYLSKKNLLAQSINIYYTDWSKCLERDRDTRFDLAKSGVIG